MLCAARPGDGARLFAPLVVLAGVVVSAEYLLEFLGAVDPAAGESFVRVSRRQGIVLPVAMLLLANGFVHDPRRWGRPLLLALFLFIGLGFAITLGRGMWAAFGLGLLVTVWLWHRSQPAARRRAWKAALLAAGVVAALVLTALAFQRLTGAALSAHAVERSRTFLDVTRDVQVVGRFLGYASAWEEILEHPFLGGGQGATFTAWSFNPDAGRFGDLEGVDRGQPLPDPVAEDGDRRVAAVPVAVPARGPAGPAPVPRRRSPHPRLRRRLRGHAGGHGGSSASATAR